jgi:hypothetical protein
MIVDYYTYKDQEFTCRNCGWQGKGNELLHGDFSELHLIGDLDCPQCDDMVAHWQAPLISDKKTKSKKPGK